MISSMATSFFINRLQKPEKAPLDQEPSGEANILSLLKLRLETRFKESVLMTTYKLLAYMRKQYALLIFHAVLNLLLTFDKKDHLTLGLFAVEALVIPIHIFLYFRSSKAKPQYACMFWVFLPVFIMCLLFSIFRYLLFFQKYHLPN
jgi:hypothetical protein